MQTKICRNRQIFLCFGIAGRRDVFFIGWRVENNLDLQSRLLTLNKLKANFCLYSLNRSLNNLKPCLNTEGFGGRATIFYFL